MKYALDTVTVAETGYPASKQGAIRQGDRVTTSTVLTTLDTPAGLEAYVSVPVERAPLLRAGLSVQIVDAAGKLVAETRLDFISPQVDDQTQTVLVKAPVDARASLSTLGDHRFGVATVDALHVYESQLGGGTHNAGSTYVLRHRAALASN